MTLYLDTSVIVKLYLREDDSETVRGEVTEADTVVTSVLAYAEVCAAFDRRRRERTVQPGGLAAARQAFESEWSSWLSVTLDEQLARQAGRLAAAHGLKGADAVHLASFERVLAAAEDEDVRFRCADERLSKAARRLG